MPELVELGHIYIAQPPLYKVKAGRDERYLKDDLEEASYMMSVALNTAVLIPREGADPITGEPPAELVRKFNLANAIMTGVTLDLGSLEAAEASARALTDGIAWFCFVAGETPSKLNEFLRRI